MAGGHKHFGHPGRETKIKERREGQPHAAPFIGDGRSAQTTAHLAGKHSVMDVLIAVIEFQAVYASGYPDIALVENGCPLHGCAVQALACLAMADFGIHRVGTHFDLNRLAETACPVFDDKAGIFDRGIFGSEFFFHNFFNHPCEIRFAPHYMPRLNEKKSGLTG